MLTESQKLAVALTLFGVAILFAGIKLGMRAANEKIARQFSGVLMTAISSAHQNADLFFGGTQVNVNVNGVRDTLTINPVFKTVESEKNFEYDYAGTKVKCSVDYDHGEEAYEVVCTAY